MNRDADLNAGKPQLAGWRVFLDQNGNGARDAGEPDVITASSAGFNFTNLSGRRLPCRGAAAGRMDHYAARGDAPVCQADFSHDGKVDITDSMVLATSFNKTLPAAPAPAPAAAMAAAPRPAAAAAAPTTRSVLWDSVTIDRDVADELL